jgi:hypothetical protein
MEKEFIPYEQALALKELGFDKPCFGHFLNKKFYLKSFDRQGDGITLRPTYSQAFRFFREKYGLNSHIHQESRNNYSYCCGQGYSDEIGGYQDFETYEEAQLECLKKLIEIVKKK